QNLIEHAAGELNVVSQAMRIELVQNIEELNKDAQLLAKYPAIQSMDPDEQAAYLQLALNHYKRYGQLAIIDLSGQILLTARDQEFINIIHIESFQKAAAGEQAWVVAPGLFNDTLVLHMHTPIMSGSGEDAVQVGVLGSPSPFGNLSVFLDKYDHDVLGSVFVLGQDNRILIHPDPEIRETRPDFTDIVTSEDLVLAEPVRIESDGQITKYGSFEEDGVTFLAAFTTIESLGWTIVIKKRLSIVLAPAQLIQNIGFVIVSILIFMNVLLLIFIRRRITLPVESLALAVTELEAGNAEVVLPTVCPGQVEEISKLIQSFTSMRSAVADREQKLQKFNETLEEKIDVRTAELQQLNKDMQEEIQEHKRTTVELKQSRDDLETASRAKDSFLARMSHELRTPLNAIIGYSELMEEAAIEENDPHIAEDANTIKMAAHHLTGIISNILDYSEIQSKTVQLNKSPFSLDSLIKNVCFIVQPTVDKNGNQMIVNNHTPNEFLYSDELKLRQILTHLLGNAAKFTSKGTVSLDVWLGKPGDPRIPLDESRNWLIIHVNDTGVGIPKRFVDSIFNPFSQLNESFDRVHEGAGLGLVLSRNFVDLLDGTITVESQHGLGSSFEVKIPLEAIPA
ncbi:MAG: signal transduction histidine kinase, partial [Cellvibrionaceae bacterium]